MLTLKDFPQALITYYRKPNKYTAKVVYNEVADDFGNLVSIPTAVLDCVRGERKGVLVAIGPGIVGWSMCKEPVLLLSPYRFREGDDFNKALGLHIALTRAIKVKAMSTWDKQEFYDSIPTTMQPAFKEMMDRSYKYFQIPNEEDEEWYKS